MERRDRDLYMNRWIIEYDLHAAINAPPPPFPGAPGARVWTLRKVGSECRSMACDPPPAEAP